MTLIRQGVTHIRLSELNQKIGNALSNALSNHSWWVIADVTNHTYREQKAYHNFELVEKDTGSNRLLAKISGKAWGNGSFRIEEFERTTGQRFTNNISVLVNVSVEYHPVYGLQVNLNDIDASFTLGALEQQRQADLERLVRENPEFIRKSGSTYVTKNNQLTLNAVIQRIAVISSKTSAGGEDFKHTLDNNPFGYTFVVDHYYTVVQGENNADQFLSKIIEVFNSGKPYDAVVIARGGGAQTDFLIFDNYYIGRAIARFPIPIITGIGHQRNETIADLMAHTQTKTPTKAAEFIIAHNKHYEDAVTELQARIIIKSQQVFLHNYQALASSYASIVNSSREILSIHKESISEFRQNTIETVRRILFHNRQSIVNISSQIVSKPKIILYNRINDIGNKASNIRTFSTQYIRNVRAGITHLESMVRIMKPDNILKRGFAILKANNRIINSTGEIEVGSKLDIITSDAKLQVSVNKKERHDGSAETNL